MRSTVFSHLILSERADSSGSVQGAKMADSILTGNVLLRDWKGRRLSLQASMRAVEGNGKEETYDHFYYSYI